MLKSAEILNQEFSSALPQPVRIGIGIHSGSLVMARIGDDEHGYMSTALGETVTVASRLENATKELLADCLVSRATLQTAGLPIPTTEHREIHMTDRNEPIAAYPLESTIAAVEGDSHESAAEPAGAQA